MELPDELRWIGPLFVILYCILWIGKGPILLYLLFILPILLLFLLPLYFIGTGIVVIVLYKLKLHRFTIAIILLCVFSSGFFFTPIHIPYIDAYLPIPASSYVSAMIFTPFILIPMIPWLSLGHYHPFFTISIILLYTLTAITCYIFHLVSERRMNYVKAMLAFVIILVVWTYTSFPLSIAFANMLITPIPLGPLVALNILPWTRVSEMPPELF